MGDKLQPVTGPKTDAFSSISKWMENPGGVPLNADAETMLKRLLFADQKLKTRKLTEAEINEEMQTTFSISSFTAMRDIKNAQKLFARARQINKSYTAALHLERINKDIEDARERLFWEEKDDMPGVKFPRTPDAKELAALAKLHDAYTYTLNTAPEEEKQNTLPPPVFNFILTKGAQIHTTMEPMQALAAADNLLNSPDIGTLADSFITNAEWEEMPDDEPGDDLEGPETDGDITD